MSKALFSAIALSALGATTAHAQDWTFDRILDNATPLPGQSVLAGELGKPVFDGTRAVFVAKNGTGTQSPRGVYLTDLDGNVITVVDGATDVPGETWTFHNFDIPSMDDGVITFSGRGFFGGDCCTLYRWEDGLLTVVASNDTPTPDGVTTFNHVGDSSLSGTRLAFSANSTIPGQGYNEGVYLHNQGTISKIMDMNDPVPGSPESSFFMVRHASAEGSDIAFYGAYDPTGGDDESAVFLYRNGITSAVASTADSPPGSSTRFLFMDVPALDDGKVYFGARNGPVGTEGLYVWDDGELRTLIDSSVLIPATAQTFHDFGVFSADNGNLAFLHREADGNSGLYALFDGHVSKILDAQDVLDGRSIVNFELSTSALVGNTVIFTVRFTGGHRAIYTATIPTPGAIALLPLGGLFLSTRRRRV